MDNNSVMDNAPVISQEPVVEAVQERMLPQSTVNELIGNAKREAAEKAAARAVEDYKRSLQPASPQPTTGFNDEYFERKTLDILEKQKSEWERQQQEKIQTDYADRIVTAYKEKIAAGRDKYQDFEAVTGNVNMAYYPNVVQLLAEHVDNAPDILYNLAQRRGKLDEIDRLCERNPQDAIYELKRLSDSIKANESTNQIKSPKTPLSQQRPSNSGTDSGALTIADYKRMFRG